MLLQDIALYCVNFCPVTVLKFVPTASVVLVLCVCLFFWPVNPEFFSLFPHLTFRSIAREKFEKRRARFVRGQILNVTAGGDHSPAPPGMKTAIFHR